MGRESEQNQLYPLSSEDIQHQLQAIYRRRWVKLIAGILLTVIPLAMMFIWGEAFEEYLIPLMLSLVLGIVLLMLSRGQGQAKQLAAQIAEVVIKETFGADTQYDPSGHIPEEYVAASGFVDGWDRFYGGDLVRGHYRNIPIMFSDVHLQQIVEEYNDKTKRYETKEYDIFKGYWLVADFDRELTAVPLTVMEKRTWGNPIRMESEAFNRQFTVYCDDAHMAFYILTPHFMERLVEADKAAKGTSNFHFHKNHLQIAVGTKADLFEINTFKAPNVDAIRKRFQEELGLMTTVLDEMLRHERLFGSRDR